MSNYKIEKGVPVPPCQTHTGLTATLMAMEPGDSFGYGADDANSVRAAAARLARIYDRQYITRKLSNQHYRVWRQR